MASFVHNGIALSTSLPHSSTNMRDTSFLCHQRLSPVPSACCTRAVMDSIPAPGTDAEGNKPSPPPTSSSAVNADAAVFVEEDNTAVESSLDVQQTDLKISSEQLSDNDEDLPSKDSTSWYSVIEEIAKPDTGGTALPEVAADGGDEVLDLMDLESAGRQVLAKSSYESVVDVNVEDGGVLQEDEDNNDLFSGVGLDALIESPVLLANLENEFHITTATHVQLAAIPRVLDERDLVMQSYTGTGKTLAFLLPILDELDTSVDITQTMIVAPTRELAMQISRECDRLTVNTDIRTMPLIGGANPARQVDKLKRTFPHVVVGTPGRLAELAENNDLRTRKMTTLVVDEIDQCLVGEFGEQVHRLLRSVPRKTQKVLVSATGDVDTVRKFAGESLHKPVLLRVGGSLRIPRNIQHWMCVVPARMKIDLVRKLMYTNPVPERAIVFVDDPRRVEIVSERLWQLRVPVGALRGNAHKMERKEVLQAFRKGKIQVLVSTEVAARGLDVPEMTHVINLDLPTDADHYVHRAGRCGRVGRDGHVISITSGDNAFVMRRLSKEVGLDIARMEPRNGEYGEPSERSTERRPRKGPVAKEPAGDKNEVMTELKRPAKQQRPDLKTEKASPPRVQNVETSKVANTKSFGAKKRLDISRMEPRNGESLEPTERSTERRTRKGPGDKEPAGDKKQVMAALKRSAQQQRSDLKTDKASTPNAETPKVKKLLGAKKRIDITGTESSKGEYHEPTEKSTERRARKGADAEGPAGDKNEAKAALKRSAQHQMSDLKTDKANTPNVETPKVRKSFGAKKRSRNMRERAASERWVGNRSGPQPKD